ncbi:hypothetical protein [Bacillus sp. FJAT-29814]|uniref:YfjL-like protein n=1 Tax=Bacillus sp. FJAT-29814 TaxID=1729688 RepID=UPI00082D1F62|nr:hypothetical protein [Bacillus sp. FJAT-29814]
MSRRKVILWSVGLLLFILGLTIYFLFNGTPWEKNNQEKEMQQFLENKYQMEFVFKKMSYNYLSETYQAYAYPKGHSDVEFMVQEDMDSKAGYSDTYPKAFWESELSRELKEKIKDLFPNLDESNFQALQIVERGEYFGKGIPTYQQVPASHLDTSISIKIIGNWERMDQQMEIDKIKELGQYLKTIHFPVLIEVWYIEDNIHNINENTKAFFITENGAIIEG